LAVHPRHIGVDFDDQLVGLSCHRADVVVVGAEREVAVLIHWGHRHNAGVDRNRLGEQPHRPAKRGRDEIDHLATVLLAALDQLTLGALQEHRVRQQSSHQFVMQDGLGHRGFGVKVVHLDAIDLATFGAAGQGA